MGRAGIMSEKIEKFLPNLFASFVLFLIAIPLNLGIALASGASPTQGLTTGVVAALIVSLLAGAPLMISAPATGLIAVVWQITDLHGMENLGFVVLMAGLCQMGIGFFNLGPWFRAVTPAVIHGMLAGIGILIFACQFHVMMGLQPDRTGIKNIITIPATVLEAAGSGYSSAPFLSGVIGIVTIVLLIAWSAVPGKLKMVPPPLIGVGGAILLAWFGKFEVAYVKVPEELSSEFNLLSLSQFSLLSEPSVWGSILGLTFIATAQTLLTATAVDRLHEHEKTDYNKEVKAQGVGNLLAGLLGSLPLCGVIVRSGASVQSGSSGRWANFMHGVWLALFVLAFSSFLALIPIPTLAAVLVYTGVRLVKIESIRELRRFGTMELVIYFVTVATIVAADLLTGILAGFTLSALRLLYNLTHCEIKVQQEEGGPIVVTLTGSATFFTLPSLARRLESLPKEVEIEVLVEHLHYIDHACLEQILIWEEEYIAQGGRISIAWNHLMGRFNSSPSKREVAPTNGHSQAFAIPGVPQVREIQGAPEEDHMIAEEHYLKLRVSRALRSSILEKKAIWELSSLFPPNVLIVLVQRKGEVLIPKGKKVLQDGDVITILGGPEDIARLREEYSDCLVASPALAAI